MHQTLFIFDNYPVRKINLSSTAVFIFLSTSARTWIVSADFFVCSPVGTFLIAVPLDFTCFWLSLWIFLIVRRDSFIVNCISVIILQQLFAQTVDVCCVVQKFDIIFYKFIAVRVFFTDDVKFFPDIRPFFQKTEFHIQLHETSEFRILIIRFHHSAHFFCKI